MRSWETAIDAAVRADDAPALFALATRALVDPEFRNLEIARLCLRQAVKIGHVDAALIEIAMTANGSGGAASWPTARALLGVAATHDPVAAAQQDLLATMDLTEDGYPRSLPAPVTLASTPRLRMFPRLLTAQECAHIARAAADLLEPATVIDPVSGRSIPHPIRTSHAGVLGPLREDLVVRAINLRVAAATATDVAQGEALTVLRYTPGQQFRQHLDTIAGAQNQRAETVIIYLNDGFEGGETLFPLAGAKIKPRAGDAIHLVNVDESGRPDPASVHAGLPVTRGVKWVATRWLRAKAYDPWCGPEASVG